MQERNGSRPPACCGQQKQQPRGRANEQLRSSRVESQSPYLRASRAASGALVPHSARKGRAGEGPRSGGGGSSQSSHDGSERTPARPRASAARPAGPLSESGRPQQLPRLTRTPFSTLVGGGGAALPGPSQAPRATRHGFVLSSSSSDVHVVHPLVHLLQLALQQALRDRGGRAGGAGDEEQEYACLGGWAEFPGGLSQQLALLLLRVMCPFFPPASPASAQVPACPSTAQTSPACKEVFLQTVQ